MATNVKQMLEAANAAVPRITSAQAREMIAKGNTLVVDVRDPSEVQQSGKVAGAVNVSRGMLEFRADPESPYPDKNVAKNKSVIVYGRAMLFVALALAASLVYVPVFYWQTRKTVPPIHDITTDLDNPPAFSAVLPARAAERAGSLDRRTPQLGELQKAAYPDLAPLAT